MAGITYTDYEMILDTTSMAWVAFGYFTHIVLSMMQASLAGVLLVSAFMNLIFKENTPLKSFFQFFGLTIDLNSNNRFLIAGLQFLLGLGLLAPLALNSSHLLAACAALIAALFLLYIEIQVVVRESVSSKFFSSAFIAFAVLSSGFSFYEEKDNLKFGIKTAFKAKKHRDAEIAWQLKNDPQSPKLGQQAPDFTLTSADGSTSHALSDFLGSDKPVVLFFGANSCPAFSQGTIGINRIHERFKDRVHFVGVYVKEPHPSDEWWLTPSKFMTKLHAWENSRAAVDIKQPVSFEEKQFFANRAHQNLLNKGITFLVDDVDNQVNNRWTGQPTRIYLISPNGEIIYNPGSGPYSFNPDYLEPILEKYFES